MKKLNTINADTQQIIPHAPLVRRGGDLLPQGLHLLAGAPKIGPVDMSLCRTGQIALELRYIPVRSLYLYLEDSFQRIQSLLFDLTPPSLHFAMMAEQLHSGLVEQIA